MKINYVQLKPWERFTLDGQELICCGNAHTENALITRKWKRTDLDRANSMTSDNHMFAPSVRQRRIKQGYMHDAHAKKGISELYGSHPDSSVILVGCGPSMPAALPVVRELREKHGHIVISTNNSLQHGYAPLTDYYILLCWLSQAWWWHGIDTEKMKCITSFHTTFEVIRDFPNRYYFDDSALDVTVDRPEARLKWGALDGGMSVVFSAMHMAFKMGAKRIVFVGMDLSYTNYFDHPGDRLNYAKAQKRGPFVVQDLFGNATLSDKGLVAQRDLLKGQCIFLEEEGVECVNITNAGILGIRCCLSPEEYLKDVQEGNWYLDKEKKHGDGIRGAPVGAVHS